MHEKGNTNGNLERGESNEVLGQGLACLCCPESVAELSDRMLHASGVSVLGSPFAFCSLAETSTKAPPEAELVVKAKLVAIEPAQSCGRFHFSEVAEYADITVLRGVWNSGRLRVVHGCTELPRSQYASGAGTLERFTIGDYHRLELTLHDIYKTGRRLKTEDAASAADYFSLRVDLTEEPVEGATCKSGWLGKREVH